MATSTRSKSRYTYLVRQNFRFRTAGMPFMGAVLAISIYTLNNPVFWVFLGLHVLLWPSLARWLATRSSDPDKQEYRNLHMEAAIYGLWLPVLAFSPVPSLLLAITCLSISPMCGLKPVGIGVLCGVAWP